MNKDNYLPTSKTGRDFFVEVILPRVYQCISLISDVNLKQNNKLECISFNN